jgi:hypothetical protein
MHFTREDVIAIARYARIVAGLRREEDMIGRGLLHAANALEHQLVLYPCTRRGETSSTMPSRCIKTRPSTPVAPSRKRAPRAVARSPRD